jgi:hypothetical protein
MKKTSAISFFLINVLCSFNFSLASNLKSMFVVEPKANPGYIQFTNVKPYTFTVSFDKVTSAERYLVLVAQNESILGFPNDGETYQKGDRILNANVVYLGSDTSFVPRGIRANTKYHFLIFACNGSGGEENYLQIKPTIGSVSTGGLLIGSYYDGVSRTAPNFILALTELINPHKVMSYASYKTTILQNLELIDTIAGQMYVECAYSGEKKIINEPFDWVKSGYSREHIFPHSWMPTYPADSPPLPEYSDFHNLYPANLDKANSIRSNYPLGEIDGKVTYEYLDGRLGYRGNQIVYEPRDNHKGNVARAIFYMCIAYNGINNNAWKLPSNQDQYILKKWHFQDPPDKYEIARQEYVFHLQGNRNPFIDSANYVCSIDFSKLGQPATCNDIPLEVDQIVLNEKLSFSFKDNLFCISGNGKIAHVKLVNLLGENIVPNLKNNDCIYLSKGFYVVSYEVDSIVYTYKLFASDF